MSKQLFSTRPGLGLGLGTLLGLALAGLVSAGVSQTGSTPAGQGTDPLGASPEPQLTRQERLEAGLIGCWNLMLYESPGRPVDPRNVTTFLTFQDGYSTVYFRASVTEQTIFGGLEERPIVQAEVRRYRVSEFLDLQTAPVHVMDNFGGELRVSGAMEPTEYALELEKDELVLSKIDGTRMTFRRVVSDRFPQRAVDRLNSTRGGLVPLPPDPSQRGR